MLVVVAAEILTFNTSTVVRKYMITLHYVYASQVSIARLMKLCLTGQERSQ